MRLHRLLRVRLLGCPKAVAARWPLALLAGLALSGLSLAVPFHLPVAWAQSLTTYELNVTTPTGLRPRSVAVGASGSLLLRDRSRVEGIASNLGAGQTDVGVEAHTKDVYSEPRVTLRDRAAVDGSIVTKLAPAYGNQTQVAGAVSTNGLFSDPEGKTFLVEWPNVSVGDIDLQPDQTMTITPGRRGNVSVKSRSTPCPIS